MRNDYDCLVRHLLSRNPEARFKTSGAENYQGLLDAFLNNLTVRQRTVRLNKKNLMALRSQGMVSLCNKMRKTNKCR